VKNLNAVFTRLSTRRRYEVWFLRLGLADGRGAWWFRYLLMNPGRSGCAGTANGMPVQVWATWFPPAGRPQSFIQGFSLDGLQLSPRSKSPFHFGIVENTIGADCCKGRLEVDGHSILWDLHYQSTAHLTLSDKGWIGFSRTPHSNAIFSGEINFDGQRFKAEPLGWGVQGHNCGYRHRNQWTWTHACFRDGHNEPCSLEALTYEMPLGLRFRKAVLWHRGKMHIFRKFQEQVRDPKKLEWDFKVYGNDSEELEISINGAGESLHRLPYVKTDCSGTFEVANNSLSQAKLLFRGQDGLVELATADGAVLEMTG
jgi:hypothetical protein